MLTVRVIRPDGSQWIEEATGVSLNTAEQSASGRQSLTFFLNGKEMVAQDVYEGHVYVMNEFGKTIGNFNLGVEPKTE